MEALRHKFNAEYPQNKAKYLVFVNAELKNVSDKPMDLLNESLKYPVSFSLFFFYPQNKKEEKKGRKRKKSKRNGVRTITGFAGLGLEGGGDVKEVVGDWTGRN